MPAENAVDFRRALLQQNVLVRDCASFGLPGYLRIATRQPAENERLVAAIQTIQVDQPLRPSGI
jgi:histidinol-phosphate/aromatic aminotransferase/cobyric acid decarboxylase-like protein